MATMGPPRSHGPSEHRAGVEQRTSRNRSGSRPPLLRFVRTAAAAVPDHTTWFRPSNPGTTSTGVTAFIQPFLACSTASPDAMIRWKVPSRSVQNIKGRRASFLDRSRPPPARPHKRVCDTTTNPTHQVPRCADHMRQWTPRVWLTCDFPTHTHRGRRPRTIEASSDSTRRVKGGATLGP